MEAAAQGAINRPITGLPPLFPCLNITSPNSRLILCGSTHASPEFWLVKIRRERGGEEQQWQNIEAAMCTGGAVVVECQNLVDNVSCAHKKLVHNVKCVPKISSALFKGNFLHAQIQDVQQ